MGGYIFLLSDRSVSWQSKHQTVISTSLTEAEYIEQYNTAREAVQIQLFLDKLGLRDLIANPLNILADNNRLLKLSKDSAFHSQAKHLDVKYHWQHQEIERKTITIIYIPLDFNRADGLIKFKDSRLFYIFKSLIRILEVNKPSEPMDIEEDNGRESMQL